MRHFKAVHIVVFVVGVLMAGTGLPASAQTGPGGVDDTSATNGTDLRVWLRADDGVRPTTDGSTVSEWLNQVGGTAATAENGAATFEGSELGGKPVIRFNEGVSAVDNATDYLDYATQDGSLDGKNTLIVVSKNAGELFSIYNQAPIGFGTFPDDKAPNGRGMTYSLDAQTGNDEILFSAVSGDAKAQQGNGRGNGNGGSPAQIADTKTYNVTPFSIYSSVADPGAGSQDLLANGEILKTGPASAVSSSSARIGERLIGDLAEVIVFDKEVNAAERAIIHNYLSTKYGIALENAVPDLYRFDSGYPGDLAGTGRADAIGEASQGGKSVAQSSGLHLDTGSKLSGTGEFALYGHDRANLAFTDVEPPNGQTSNIQKMAREWRVDMTKKTSANGITMGFDESVLPSSETLANTSYNDYYLYVDDDGDFTSGATAYDLQDQGGGLYTTPADVTISDGDYVTVARIQRTIRFSKKEDSNFENANGNNSDNPVSVTASLNFADSKSLSVPYTVSGITKTIDGEDTVRPQDGGRDYSVSSGSFSFSAGATSNAQTAFTVIEDGENEATTEFVRVGLGSLGARVAAGAISQLDYGIIDDDNLRSIAFDSGIPSSVNEGNSGTKTQTFTVTLPDGETGPSTVLYQVEGTATAGEDYEIVSASEASATTGAVTIQSGSQTGTFDIDVIGDELDEGSDETFTVTLIGATGGTLEGSNARSATFTINDDDPVPEVTFASSGFVGTEGQSADVVVQLDGPAGRDLDVEIQDEGTGTADEGNSKDYIFPSDPSVTIPAGETQGAIPITLNTDSKVEPTETFDVSINVSQTTPPVPNSNDPPTASVSILDASGIGNSGPGGVGDASTLSLWLRSDKGVTTSSGNVTEWADQSGNDNDATQNDGAEQPAFGNASINGIDVVSFGGDDFLRTSVASLPSTNHTLFSAGNADATGAVLGIEDGSFNSLRTLEFTSVTGDTAATASQNGSTTSEVAGDGVTSVLTSTFGEGEVNIRVDGSSQSVATASTNSDGTYAFLGAEVTNEGDQQQPIPGPENAFTGDLGEMIAYSVTLNKAQRLIVENYLVAKYDIPSYADSNPNAQDLYAGDSQGGGADRDTDVVGIGQASDGTKHFSAQAGGLGLSVAGGIDNGEYVLAGRKIGVEQRLNVKDTATIGSTPVTARLNDDRYFDITGSLEADITFDFSEFGVKGPSGDASNYVLLRRGGTSGDWTKVSGNASSSGNTVTFTSVSLSEAQDGYFTIGTTNQADSPLDTRYLTIRGEDGVQNDAAYYHIGAPAEKGTATFSDLVTPSGTPVIDSTSNNPGIGREMVYTWDAAAQTWTSPAADGQLSDNTLPTGKGFILWVDDSNEDRTGDYRIDPEYTFGLPRKAAFESENVTVAVENCDSNQTSCQDHGAYYMLGNPYPEGFDLAGLNLDVDANSDGESDFQQAVDVWDSRQSSYIVKTRGTTDDEISRWQGFFVQRSTVGEGATNLTFDKTGRVSTNVPFVGNKSGKDADSENWARVGLALNAMEGGKAVSTDKAAVLLFHESARKEWDAYDLPKRGSHGPTLAPLGTGRDGATIAKAQESRRFSRRDTFTVDFQFKTGHGHSGNEFVITPHQWERVAAKWNLTLIDTKGTESSEDDEQVPLTATTTYRFERTATSMPKEAARSSEMVTKSTALPRFRLHVEGRPRPESAEDPPAEDQPSEVELVRLEASAEETQTAKGNGQGVKLQWETASASRLEGFEIQHKTEEESFTPVESFITRKDTSKTTSEEGAQYSETIEGLGYGEHEFRLKQVQADGTSTYSKVVTAELTMDEPYTISDPYPNPFQSKVKVDLTVRKAQEVRVELYDVLGRQVQRVSEARIPANETRTIRVRGDRLGAGMYFLRVQGDDFSEVRKTVHIE